MDEPAKNTRCGETTNIGGPEFNVMKYPEMDPAPGQYVVYSGRKPENMPLDDPRHILYDFYRGDFYRGDHRKSHKKILKNAKKSEKGGGSPGGPGGRSTIDCKECLYDEYKADKAAIASHGKSDRFMTSLLSHNPNAVPNTQVSVAYLFDTTSMNCYIFCENFSRQK